jgi:hypothetical protein
MALFLPERPDFAALHTARRFLLRLHLLIFVIGREIIFAADFAPRDSDYVLSARWWGMANRILAFNGPLQARLSEPA